jgi:hypothetical protein
MTAASAPPAIVVHLPAGPARRTVWIERPAGVVLRARISVPRGAAARASIMVPGVGGVVVRTSPAPPGSPEPCPFPQARWRVAVVKTSGPAGDVRVDFRIGAPQ